MNPYIEAVKDTIQGLMDNFVSQYDIADIEFGFVAYRDHDDAKKKGSYLTKVQPLTDAESMIKFIETLDAKGGGDIPEAVLDGLNEAVLRSGWRLVSNKFIFHIGDAPPHGKQYFFGKDDCPQGCCDLTIEKVAANLNACKIKYNLLKIGNYLETTAIEFSKHIKNFMACDLEDATVVYERINFTLKEDVQRLRTIVTQSMDDEYKASQTIKDLVPSPDWAEGISPMMEEDYEDFDQ